MTPIWQIGLQIVQWIQGWGAWLEPPMQLLSSLGRAQFYLVVMPALYWCLDSALGMRMALVLLLSSGVNDTLKIALRQPRPFWISRQVQALSHETSFGLPSGHAQHGLSVWGLLASACRSRWARFVIYAVIACIGLSRVYLAMHFPTDVLLGWALGALLLGSYLRLERPVGCWLSRRSRPQQIGLSVLASLGLLGLPLLSIRLTDSWQMPAAWHENIMAHLGQVGNPRSLEGALLSSGMLLGMCVGRISMVACGDFAMAGRPAECLLRYLVGMVGLAMLWFGLGQILPTGDTPLVAAIEYLQAVLVGLWVTVLAPLLFRRLGLCQRA